MTLLSICILTGYVILHILFIFFLDRQLNILFQNRPAYQKLRPFWIILFAAAAAAPVIPVFIPEGAVSLSLQRFGNVFLAFDLHIVGLFFLASLICRIVFSFIRTGSAKKPPLWLLLLVLSGGILIPLYGIHHAQDTVVTFCRADLRGNRAVLPESTDVSVPAEDSSDISEDTSGNAGRNLRIALIADLHLGVNSHLAMTQNVVRLINEQEPDVVLVAGDIFTSSYAALREPEKHAEALSEIRAPMGVYAVYGNHDVEETLFSGFAVHPVSQAFRTEQMEQFFRDCGFTMLSDETVSIADDSLLLAGRIDGNKAGDGTKNRLTPAELLENTDPEKPVLVLEHEPVEYTDLREAGADMVLSGHTHNGQVFPGNIYVKWMNENGYGQKTLYGMETFVTSGVGTFGPPMRTGTDSEIMIIDLLY